MFVNLGMPWTPGKTQTSSQEVSTLHGHVSATSEWKGLKLIQVALYNLTAPPKKGHLGKQVQKKKKQGGGNLMTRKRSKGHIHCSSGLVKHERIQACVCSLEF